MGERERERNELSYTWKLQSIGVCDRLIVDASASSGGAGRAMSYFWSVSMDTGQVRRRNK